jgi:CDP-diacylglycerol---serine O-phosphatidyltransferase
MKVKKGQSKLYFLPSLFSLTNLFFGFLSIQMSLHGRYRWAAFWIIVAAVMDGFDGIVARATKSQSDFGIELDSLADAVSFGVAASLLIYLWGLSRAGAAGVFFSFVFLSAGILRLARYNVRTKAQPDRRYYQGLTVPSAAMFMSAMPFLHPAPVQIRSGAFLFALLALFVAFCMVSTLPYRNFLNALFNRRIDMKSALFLSIIVAGLIFYPKIFMLAFFTLNVVSGPVLGAVRALKKAPHKRARRKEIPS